MLSPCDKGQQSSCPAPKTRHMHYCQWRIAGALDLFDIATDARLDFDAYVLLIMLSRPQCIMQQAASPIKGGLQHSQGP